MCIRDSLYTKNDHLPRQARDKHVESTPKQRDDALDEVSMADIHLEIGTIRDEDVAGEAPLHPPVTPSGLRSVRWRRRA